MTASQPRRLALAHLPTPLWHNAELDRLLGTEVWVKRDDATGGAEAGNKIRKLEFLLGAALEQNCSIVLTCGALQSNHARATALLAAGLGLASLLLLRTTEPTAPHPAVGNLLLDRLAGAEIRFITPEQYVQRDALLAEAAAELTARGERPYIIPEGGSNGLGALGYVHAMREIREQLDLGLGGGPRPFDLIVHACGSGGTAAGTVLGARHHGVADRVEAMAVCDDQVTFERVIGRIVEQAHALLPNPVTPADFTVCDEHKGPAYGIASLEQRDFIVEVARRTGLVLDPVYSGKALFGLSRSKALPARVLFLHTGGLPGLLAVSGDFFD